MLFAYIYLRDYQCESLCVFFVSSEYVFMSVGFVDIVVVVIMIAKRPSICPDYNEIFLLIFVHAHTHL